MSEIDKLFNTTNEGRHHFLSKIYSIIPKSGDWDNNANAQNNVTTNISINPGFGECVNPSVVQFYCIYDENKNVIKAAPRVYPGYVNPSSPTYVNATIGLLDSVIVIVDEYTDPAVRTYTTTHVANFIKDPNPHVKSLRSFGRNFTSAVACLNIPPVTGDDCMRDFLRNCSKLVASVIIPDGVTGNRCLKNFMTNCSLYQQSITIPGSVTGNECLAGFMSGCSKFNKPIIIPSGVSGERCLERFLYRCLMFDQNISIPTTVSGKYCMREFLELCMNFKHQISIECNLISGNHELDAFLRNAYAMNVNVIILGSVGGGNTNRLTFSTSNKSAKEYTSGVQITGASSSALRSQVPNSDEFPFYRKTV